MQTRIDTAKQVAGYHFDSVAELARYVENTSRTWYITNSESHKPTDAWDLEAGYERAWEMARYGWPEGARQAKQALKAFQPATPHPTTRNDFYGYRPNVARFCAGMPDHMVRTVRDPHAGNGSVLTLIVPVNASGSTHAKNMRNFGLGIVQYIHQLEMDGVRVEVLGALCSSVSNWRVTHTWTIKRASQPLDLAVMAFAIGHPAMFRRLGFALRERCAAPTDEMYGLSSALKLKDVVNCPAGAVILNGMKEADKVARTPEKALEYITAQIDKCLLDKEAA